MIKQYSNKFIKIGKNKNENQRMTLEKMKEMT